jgi:DNA polymerase-3 subunit epsilon/ATP-dependent DNA helicase DinG
MTMQCPYVQDGSCFLYRARRRAEAAHIVVVNHALLLSDIAAAGNVLPEYQHLVVDEAHHLEDQATQQFGFNASESDIYDWLERLHVRAGRERESGLASTLINATRASSQAIGMSPQLTPLARTLGQAVQKVREPVARFFRDLSAFGKAHAQARGDYDDRIVINRAIRVQPDWSDIETSWFAVDEKLAGVCGIVDEIAAMLSKMDPSEILDHDAVYAEAVELLTAGEELRDGVSRIIGRDDRNVVCWMTLGRYGDAPSVASAPLSVAETLQNTLFSPRKSVVLTSATLSTDEGFSYIKSRIGAPDARELRLGSPFDYRASTLLLLPSDMPEPDQVGYAAALQSALIEMAQASEGRALVLFTSHAALRTAYDGIRRPLGDRDILVLAQGLDGAPRQLLETLRTNPRTVVLGAASFWEGVDVAGDALSLLVIARLPFPVPSDPIFSARSELFDQPFEQYAVPQAILRFRQGFGRLIRSKSDRGALVVLDRRLRSRRYGESFLRSLPSCTLHEPPLRDLGDEVAAWLARPALTS